MVVTASTQHSDDGLRPVNIHKDAHQLIDLLQLVFGEQIKKGGQFQFPTIPSGIEGWWMSRSMIRRLPGFVWEENGRIVGNATLLTPKTRDRFLVANVAVHPDYRRRGIAHMMMQAVIEQVQAHQGAMILLQVVKENSAAIQLYQNLGFLRIGNMTVWQATPSQIRELSKPDDKIRIIPLGRGDWQAAYALDMLCLSNDLNWPNLLSDDVYRRGLWQHIWDFVNGRQEENWIVKQSDGQIIGLGSIISDWGRAHQLKARIHPAWQGQLEWTILAKLIRRLRYLSPRVTLFNHLDDDMVMNKLLEDARFTQQRTLTHMRLDLR